MSVVQASVPKAIPKRDLIEDVIDHVTGADFTALDARTVQMVKTLIIDTMGCAVAGSAGARIPELAGLVRGWGGKAEASVLVHGDRVPAFHAALVNGAMARAWDFDDVHEGGGGHLSASIIPTAFVLAQGAPGKVSGKTFLLAVALATDLVARLRMAQTKRSGWIAETFAPFGVVAAASRILGFTREMTLAAMGLAYAQCGSNTQGTIDGALSVRLQQGLAAKSGVLAVEFAKIGFTGPVNILQGQYGLYPLYIRNDYDPTVITRDLGRHFELINTSLKPYPSCKLTHIPIAVAAKIVSENRIAPDDIKRMLVLTNDDAYAKCASSPNKRRPRNVPDAQFSLPVTLALAVTRGGVTLSDLTPDTWNDPRIQALADTVEVRVDPEFDRMPVLISPAIVEIETRSGKTFRERADFVSGSPEQPMTREQVETKFSGCVAAAVRPMNKDKVALFLKLASDLESVDDVRPMLELLVA